MTKNLRSLVTALVGAIVFAFLVVTPTNASTSPSLPGTTSYGSKGLNEMLRVTGRLYVSLDGLGTLDGTGNLQVDKPSTGAKVVGAYLTITQWNKLTTAPTDFSLNSQTVTFTHDALGAGGSGKNFLADVTSLVKTTIDAAGAGTLNLAVNEGTDNNNIEGSSLLVIFDDPDSVWGSVIFMFGSSDTTGDSFEASFPALGSDELAGHWLSLAIGFGYQRTGLAQSSTVTITTSAELSPQTLSQVAGGYDDGDNGDGALITVGGIGDSIENNPGTSTTFVSANRTDDELYGLEDYLAAGDTSITVKSINPSNNDDIYQAVLYLNRVQIENAVTVDDPEVTALVGAPSYGSSTPASSGSQPPLSLPKIDSIFPTRVVAGETISIIGKRWTCTTTSTYSASSSSVAHGWLTPQLEQIDFKVPVDQPTGPLQFTLNSCAGPFEINGLVTVVPAPMAITYLLDDSNDLFESMTDVKAVSALHRGDYTKAHCIVNSQVSEAEKIQVGYELCSTAMAQMPQGSRMEVTLRSNYLGDNTWTRVWFGN